MVVQDPPVMAVRRDLAEDLRRLQDHPKNIRNICILAHVDHGTINVVYCILVLISHIPRARKNGNETSRAFILLCLFVRQNNLSRLSHC